MSETSRPRTAAVDALDLVPLTFRGVRVCGERFQELEVNPMKPEKDISRMSIKKLKFRYGESDGTDRVAEDELRRRGLTDVELRGVIHNYKKGWYTPKGGPYPRPNQNPTKSPKEQPPPAETTTPKAAPDKKPIMYFGKFKGWLLSKVPDCYIRWVYGSFSNERRRFEKELRSRGYNEEDLARCRRQHPFLAKSPEKQPPKD